MATDRLHVDQRLAEIHTKAGKLEPSMSYWNALRRASRGAERRRDYEEKTQGEAQ